MFWLVLIRFFSLKFKPFETAATTCTVRPEPHGFLPSAENARKRCSAVVGAVVCCIVKQKENLRNNIPNCLRKHVYIYIYTVYMYAHLYDVWGTDAFLLQKARDTISFSIPHPLDVFWLLVLTLRAWFVSSTHLHSYFAYVQSHLVLNLLLGFKQTVSLPKTTVHVRLLIYHHICGSCVDLATIPKRKWQSKRNQREKKPMNQILAHVYM